MEHTDDIPATIDTGSNVAKRWRGRPQGSVNKPSKLSLILSLVIDLIHIMHLFDLSTLIYKHEVMFDQGLSFTKSTDLIYHWFLPIINVQLGTIILRGMNPSNRKQV